MAGLYFTSALVVRDKMFSLVKGDSIEFGNGSREYFLDPWKKFVTGIMEFENWMTCCCGKRLNELKLNRVSWTGT